MIWENAWRYGCKKWLVKSTKLIIDERISLHEIVIVYGEEQWIFIMRKFKTYWGLRLKIYWVDAELNYGWNISHFVSRKYTFGGGKDDDFLWGIFWNSNHESARAAQLLRELNHKLCTIKRALMSAEVFNLPSWWENKNFLSSLHKNDARRQYKVA